MIVISTLLAISSSVRDIERLLRESPSFRAGRMSRAHDNGAKRALKARRCVAAVSGGIPQCGACSPRQFGSRRQVAVQFGVDGGGSIEQGFAVLGGQPEIAVRRI